MSDQVPAHITEQQRLYQAAMQKQNGGQYQYQQQQQPYHGQQQQQQQQQYGGYPNQQQHQQAVPAVVSFQPLSLARPSNNANDQGQQHQYNQPAPYPGQIQPGQASVPVQPQVQPRPGATVGSEYPLLIAIDFGKWGQSICCKKANIRSEGLTPCVLYLIHESL